MTGRRTKPLSNYHTVKLTPVGWRVAVELRCRGYVIDGYISGLVEWHEALTLAEQRAVHHQICTFGAPIKATLEGAADFAEELAATWEAQEETKRRDRLHVLPALDDAALVPEPVGAGDA
jgi:hypothetical protein